MNTIRSILKSENKYKDKIIVNLKRFLLILKRSSVQKNVHIINYCQTHLLLLKKRLKGLLD